MCNWVTVRTAEDMDGRQILFQKCSKCQAKRRVYRDKVTREEMAVKSGWDK